MISPGAATWTAYVDAVAEWRLAPTTDAARAVVAAYAAHLDELYGPAAPGAAQDGRHAAIADVCKRLGLTAADLTRKDAA